MANWPKTLRVGAVSLDVASWEEVDEAIARYGSKHEISAPQSDHTGADNSQRHARGAHGLSQTDQVLLEQFAEAGDRGVLSSHVAQALGKKGKGTGPALEAWTKKIGLVTEENACAVERHKRFDGRAYRMTDHYLRAGALLLKP